MFKGHYDDWRKSRMETIKKYMNEDFFKNKTLLELGCGFADNSILFKQEFNNKILACDAKREHLDTVNKTYPDISTFIFDCDKDKLLFNVDIILHWGVLYHLNPMSITSHLTDICKHCNILLLESEILDSNGYDILQTNEEGYDQAANNIGCSPSQLYVENILETNNFNYKLILDPIINSSFHVYDWEITNDKSYKNGKRRFWICWKKTFDNPLKMI